MSSTYSYLKTSPSFSTGGVAFRPTCWLLLLAAASCTSEFRTESGVCREEAAAVAEFGPSPPPRLPQSTPDAIDIRGLRRRTWMNGKNSVQSTVFTGALWDFTSGVVTEAVVPTPPRFLGNLNSGLSLDCSSGFLVMATASVAPWSQKVVTLPLPKKKSTFFI